MIKHKAIQFAALGLSALAIPKAVEAAQSNETTASEIVEFAGGISSDIRNVAIGAILSLGAAYLISGIRARRFVAGMQAETLRTQVNMIYYDKDKTKKPTFIFRGVGPFGSLEETLHLPAKTVDQLFKVAKKSAGEDSIVPLEHQNLRGVRANILSALSSAFNTNPRSIHKAPVNQKYIAVLICEDPKNENSKFATGMRIFLISEKDLRTLLNPDFVRNKVNVEDPRRAERLEALYQIAISYFAGMISHPMILDANIETRSFKPKASVAPDFSFLSEE